MKVLGHEITDETIEAALAHCGDFFTSSELNAGFRRAGVPYFLPGTTDHLAAEVANRAAQALRRRGRIEWSRGTWRKLAQPDAAVTGTGSEA